MHRCEQSNFIDPRFIELKLCHKIHHYVQNIVPKRITGYMLDVVGPGYLLKLNESALVVYLICWMLRDIGSVELR